VKLHGAGFVVSPREAEALGLGHRDGAERHLVRYVHGKDITGRSRGAMVIDLLGLDEADVRRRFPEMYQHLLRTVKPGRAGNNRASYRDHWWLFGEPRRELRPALAGLPRYIATVETTKHRTFQFLPGDVLPDNMIVCIASDDAYDLGVLSSRPSLEWTYANSGLIGVARFEAGHRYTKSNIFDPFPFPEARPDQRRRIGDLAEELDAARKEVLAANGDLTLTGLYNLRSAVIAGATLPPADEDRRRRGRVDVLIELHDRIDAAVIDAYGWPANIDDAGMVAALVALNAARRAEERAGTVRWVRPAYQLERAGIATLSSARGPVEQIEAALPAAPVRKPMFPRDAIGQTAAVLSVLREGASLSVEAIARRYAQGRRVERRVQATLEALGRLGHVVDEDGGYRLRRAA
jgi:hypothetical protein